MRLFSYTNRKTNDPLSLPCPECSVKIYSPAMSYQEDWSELTPGEVLRMHCPVCRTELCGQEWWDLTCHGSAEG